MNIFHSFWDFACTKRVLKDSSSQPKVKFQKFHRVQNSDKKHQKYIYHSWKKSWKLVDKSLKKIARTNCAGKNPVQKNKTIMSFRNLKFKICSKFIFTQFVLQIQYWVEFYMLETFWMTTDSFKQFFLIFWVENRFGFVKNKI